jgi:hypothetical protein
MNNAESTLVAIVLDRSGSMASVKDEVIGGFNKMLEENKQLPGKCLVTLVQFDDEYEVIYSAEPIEKVAPLNENTYQPRAFTRLYDALGKTIDDVGIKLAAMAEDERPKKIIVVVLTDGMENASKEYSGARVQTMIAHQRDKYQWEFAFHGCQEAALQQARTLGVASQNVIGFVAGKEGTSRVMGVMSQGLRSYRGGGTYSKN